MKVTGNFFTVKTFIKNQQFGRQPFDRGVQRVAVIIVIIRLVAKQWASSKRHLQQLDPQCAYFLKLVHHIYKKIILTLHLILFYPVIVCTMTNSFTAIRAVTKSGELGISPGYYEQVTPGSFHRKQMENRTNTIELFSSSIPTY